MEQAQIESRMQSIREEIRQIQNSIDSCEQYGQGLRVSKILLFAVLIATTHHVHLLIKRFVY